MSTEEPITYKFAFVVDGDVGMCLTLPPNPDQTKHVNSLRNNPEIVEQYSPSRYAQFPFKFSFVNDGVVNYEMEIPDTPAYARFIACLQSNPTIIEVESSNPVRGGWTYDGTNFNPPA